ncbi:MAG: tRNA (cytidine(34)-2'-O)-methyltransferase [Kiritimatiellales bacterium]|nr:tRNA (cytidine(34)-2'-O)-methyltransferase [Kiritimatiellales bacterium]
MNTRPRTEIPFQWPDPPFNIVLVEPDIPQNTGNIARLCAATGTTLNLVEPLGFQLTDKLVKRAGLDYWDSVNVQKHSSLESFLNSKLGTRPPKAEAPRMRGSETANSKRLFFSTNGSKNYTEADYQPGDCLIFGSESKGLPLELLEAHPEDVYNIPIQLDHVRSLNLANAASIVLYEALRQVNAATI